MTQENQIVSRLFFKSSLLTQKSTSCTSYASNTTNTDTNTICFKKIFGIVPNTDFYTTEITIKTLYSLGTKISNEFTLSITNSNFQVFGPVGSAINISIRLTGNSVLTMTVSGGTWTFKGTSQNNGEEVPFTDYFNSEWKKYAYCSFPVSFVENANIETVLNPFQP